MRGAKGRAVRRVLRGEGAVVAEGAEADAAAS